MQAGLRMEEGKWGPLLGPLSFINVSCGKEEVDDVGDSRKNLVEVALVIRFIQTLHKAWKNCRKPIVIAVASQYRAQVAEIQDKLGDKYQSFHGFLVNAMPIQDLRDKEADIVILSTVRSQTTNLIESPCDHPKCDLASIRARCCLWILGNEGALSRTEFWKSYISDLKNRNCFFNIEADQELHGFALRVKKEIDQLDAMLESDGLLFRNTRWKVLLSDNFKKSFEKIESSGMKKLVINMLLRLANGWRPKRRNISITCDRSKHVVKKFQVKRLHVICSIDIVKEGSYLMQVLRVWDLLPMCDIPELVKRLDNMFLTYTDDFLKRCNTRCVEGDSEIPSCWENSYDIKRHKESGQIEEGVVKKSKVSDNFLLMKFYSVSSGLVNHLLSGCNGTELELPFELTTEEMEIVHFERTSFVLGRSGTGKTTVLIRKLFQREQLYHLASEGFHELECCTYKEESGDMFLRQIFVTLNPRLCYVVKEQLSEMKRFVYGGKISEENVSADLDSIEEMLSFRDIPDSFEELPAQLYPLAITLEKFLVMLDGTLGDSFFDRLSPRLRNSATSNSIALKAFIRMKEVTFHKFDLSYWPHFDKALTKSLEASSVFTEIMSHIKGGLHGEKLSLSDYLLLSERRVSNYNTQERKTIYDIYVIYEKKKSANGEYDMADLVIDLHDRLKGRGYEGDRFDFVYIDEVQDLTMSQIALFKYICSNVESGFFFSGDTAQTIAKGVDYRFEDARRLFYEEFVMKKGQKGLLTDLFQLNANFRTHASVLRLAQSITDLIYHFFPLSIDVLIPETSLVGGEMPVLIESSDGQNALTTIFRNSVENGKDLVGFGAEQVILVRDDNVRNGILKYVRKSALILTIAECKGLEFQDVLLYNFLSTSPLESRWRVIYEYMKENNIVNEESERSFPRFDKLKHALLCSELKQLYVAITRTKQRLWIVEDVDDFCNPVFDYWKLLKTVEVRRLDSIFVDEIKVTSSNCQWILRGIEFLNQKNYEAAKVCFKRANEQRLKRLAKAGGLRTSAWNVSCSDSEVAHEKLRKAAQLYTSISKFEESAECFYEAKEYALAGEIYEEKFGNSKLEEAGECFSLAGLYCRAAIAFARGKFFPSCIDACIDGKLFDEGLNYIKEWENYATLHNNNVQQIKAKEQKVLESAAFHHLKLGDKVTMMDYVRSFDSRGSIRNFLKIKDCPDELLELEEEWGNFKSAAVVAEQMGKTMRRVDLLEKAKCFEEASLTILSFVHASSLWSHGSNGWPLKQFEGKERLLERAVALAKEVSSRFHNSVSLEAEILSSTQKNSLRDLHWSLDSSQRRQIVRSQIVCARKILDIHLTLRESEYKSGNVMLRDYNKQAKRSLSANQVSMATLIYIWKVWNQKIERIFNYFETRNSEDDYGKFCLDHLGVTETKHFVSDKTIWVLQNPNANWVKQIDDKYLRRRGDSVSCKATQFVQAARSYWSSESLSVGLKVCNKLRDVYESWKRKSLPLLRQVMPLLCMFEVAKSLIDSKFLYRDYNDRTRLRHFLKESCNSFSQGFIITPEEFITDTKNPNLAELGKAVMMVIAVNGRLNEETCTIIYRKFHHARNENNSNIGSRVSRVLKLHKELQETYYAERLGEKEHISPGGFVSLVERVVIAMFSLKGCFISTKSCFLDWAIDNASLDTESDWLPPELYDSIDIMAAIIFELLYNTEDVVSWIENYNCVPHREFVVRLLVVLYLLCINTENKYYDLLCELAEREEMCKKLCCHAGVGTVAKALAENGNPLVIAKNGRQWVERGVPRAIFVDLNVDVKRAELLGFMFSQSCKERLPSTSTAAEKPYDDSRETFVSDDGLLTSLSEKLN